MAAPLHPLPLAGEGDDGRGASSAYSAGFGSGADRVGASFGASAAGVPPGLSDAVGLSEAAARAAGGGAVEGGGGGGGASVARTGSEAGAGAPAAEPAGIAGGL